MNTLYTFTIPVFIKTLSGLKTILTKAQSSIQETGMTEATLLADRLAPDMFPLVKQVQVACDNAKNSVARLSGVEAPKFEDTEETIAELLTRIDATIAFLKSVPEDTFVDTATRQIVLPHFPTYSMTGFDYAREYALPNFFFHVVTAYGIVRKNGVAISKADYIHGLTQQPL